MNKNKNNSPPEHPRYEADTPPVPHIIPVGKLTPRVFRLGVGSEVMADLLSANGDRQFYWLMSSTDAELATMAGWRRYWIAQGQSEKNPDEQVGLLHLPLSTRPASGALSSLPAWEAEKEELLQFVGNYVNEVWEQYGAVDTSLSLSTVAVPRIERTPFVVPPHHLTQDQAEISVWYRALVDDVYQVLENDPAQHMLVAGLANNLSRVGVDQ